MRKLKRVGTNYTNSLFPEANIMMSLHAQSIGLTVLTCSFISAALTAQDTVSLTSAFGEPGSTVQLCLKMTNRLPATGFQANITVGTNGNTIIIDPDAIIPVPPEGVDALASWSVKQETDGIALGAIVDYSNNDYKYPEGADQVIALIPVTITGDAVVNETYTIELINQCGDPPKDNLLLLRDEQNRLVKTVLSPDDLHSGTIKVKEKQSPPRDLTAGYRTGDNSVQLTWTNQGEYFKIELFRDGELLDTLSGDAETCEDQNCSAGEHVYGIKAYGDWLGYPLQEDSVSVPIDTLFRRGDGNVDGITDISDAVFTLSYLFASGEYPKCADAVDANDDGAVNIADVIAVLSYLFGGTGPLPQPFPNCGIDPTPDDVKCTSYEPCQ